MAKSDASQLPDGVWSFATDLAERLGGSPITLEKGTTPDPASAVFVAATDWLTPEATGEALSRLRGPSVRSIGILVASDDQAFGPSMIEGLGTVGFHLHFQGSVRTPTEPVRAGIVMPWPPPHDRDVPPDFRVIAVMTVYNEVDILRPSLRRLHDQGVEVFVVDNWSDDGSYEVACESAGREVIGVERFPPRGPTGTYDWADLLTRVERLATTLPADWIVHHDVDEYRTGPWPTVSLRASLHSVQVAGFNAIDHTVLVHSPTDDSFQPGSDFVSAIPFFNFGRRPGHFSQIKAWNAGQAPVDLVGSGGHQARFEGRVVYPFNFLLRHYPIRSQDQGTRKVFRERKPRWNRAERDRGWHVQYDHMTEGHDFIDSPDDLVPFTDAFFEEFLFERLLRTGLKPHER